MSAASAGLFAHVAVGPGNGLEPPVRDRLSADHGLAVGPVLEPRLGALDLVERPLQVIEEGTVSARLLEVVCLVARVLGFTGGVGLPVLLELALDPGPLLGETCACAVGVHARILLTAGSEELAQRRCSFRVERRHLPPRQADDLVAARLQLHVTRTVPLEGASARRGSVAVQLSYEAGRPPEEVHEVSADANVHPRRGKAVATQEGEEAGLQLAAGVVGLQRLAERKA